MKRSITTGLTVFSITAAACTAAFGADGIFPGAYHRTAASALTEPSSTGGFNYRRYDTATIRRRAKSDPRYERLIKMAKASVEDIITKSDEEIRDLIQPADTKRALMVHRAGCPVHGGGTMVYRPFGIKVDLSHPRQVKCSIGGEWYPNAEFPDDGQGWLDERPDSPTKGDRYYFAGWFQHWFLESIGDYLKSMAQLRIITGDDIYSRKAAVLLERFAEVYPDLDPFDLTYSGTDWGMYVKMTGSFWEGTTLLNVAKAVELLLPWLPEDLVKKIHDNVYRAAYDAYRARPASGNWGNNWNPALAKFAAVMGDGEMFGFMLNDHPAAQAPVLDNQFFRDGFPYEASLSYASTYHNVAANVADAMGGAGGWIWDHPHIRQSYHSFAELVCLDRFTHFAADMGSINNTGWTLPLKGIESAYRAYRTPELARYFLQSASLHGDPGPRSLDDLFVEPLDMDEVARAASLARPMKSTVAPVRGMAVLRTGEGKNRTAAIMDFGYAHAAHHHADRLNINLFAFGREFIPEMGYPEYMDHNAPATGGWTTNTVCHATVEVDGKRQAPGVFGDLHAFADVDGLAFIDASCEDAYVHRDVRRYRRSLVLVDTPLLPYAVDIFRVTGGSRHDYLFHGPAVDVITDGPALSPPEKGTLAGEDVPFGFKPEDMAPYSLDNSGYQYLYDVRRCAVDAPWTARWRMEDSVTFSALFVPDGPETFIAASGYPRPSTKSLPPMPFLVRRRTHDTNTAESRFISILSAEKERPAVTGASILKLSDESSPSALALMVQRETGEDIIVSTLSPNGTAVSVDGGFHMNGLLGVASREHGRIVRMTLVGGSEFMVDGSVLRSEIPEIEASIREVHEDRFVLDRSLPAVSEGHLLFVDRGPVRSVYRIQSVEGNTVFISPSPWISRGRIGAVDTDTRTITDGRRIYPLGDVANGERNYYAGSWLVNPEGSRYCRIERGGNDGFIVDKSADFDKIARDFPVGGDFLVYDAGPGDTVRIVTVAQKNFHIPR